MKLNLFSFLIAFFLIQGFGFSQTSVHYQVGVDAGSIKSTVPVSLDSAIAWSREGRFDYAQDLGVANRDFEYWFEIDLGAQEELIHSLDSIYLYPSSIELGTLYIFPNGKVDSLVLARMNPDNDLRRSPSQGFSYVPVSTSDLLEGRFLLLKAKFSRATPKLGVKKFFISDPSSHHLFSGFVSHRSFRSQVLAFFFLGVAAVLMIFNLILFFNVKEPQYIYYGAFLFFQLIYYSQISPYLAEVFGYDFPVFFFWLTTISQILINLFYLLFIRYFLEFWKIMPGFDLVVKGIAFALAILILVMTLLIWLNPYSMLQARMMDWQRYFMAGFAFFGIFFLWLRYPTPLKFFVVFGTLFFTSGALLTMFLLDLDYMIAGSSIESTIFALGLSYKIKTISQEKRKAEAISFQTKLGALRAQINPHFIFNSLSSIQHLITVGSSKAALSYLSKFSKFVRQILESSLDVNVTLEKEIELLKVYLDLEALRFEHAFSYEIKVQENSDLKYQEVPMMIVQPFVENAIKHGLLPLQGRKKMLWVRFSENSKEIICEVEDNGIGRSAAAALKSDHSRPSRGIALTEERLRLLNGKSQESQIQVLDLVHGTKVIIKLQKQ